MRIFSVLLLCLSAIATTATAQTFPDKSRALRFIVPFGAGSSVDMMARAYAKVLADTDGVNVVVENKPGAETVMGVQQLLAGPRDGYSLMLTSSSTVTLNPVMTPHLSYEVSRDLIPLTGLGKVVVVMNLGPSTSFKTAREFIAAAKANPGKYTCGSASANSRLSCELLQSLAQIKLVNVPYKATAAGLTALAGGEIDMMFADPGSSTPLWQTGRIRGLAQSGSVRTPTLPQIPTLREEGVADYEVVAWFASYYPAGTPPHAVAAMRQIMLKATKTKTITDTLSGMGLEPMLLVGDELAALNRKEIDMWTKVIREANIKFN
jgi:tripartite-type tricarboxylate transporter receptor subunit TctC